MEIKKSPFGLFSLHFFSLFFYIILIYYFWVIHLKKNIIIMLGSLIVLCSIGLFLYLKPNKTIKVIYDDLLNSKSSYSKWKKLYSGITFKEIVFHNRIIIKTDNKSNIGNFHFVQNGDYITYQDDYDDAGVGIDYFKCIIDCVGERYGMNLHTLRIYIDSLLEYFKIIKNKNTITYKYYIKNKFDIPKIDSIIQKGDLKDSLDVIDDGFIIERGKVVVRVSRDKDGIITIVVGEYLENTEDTYQSILNSIGDIKPNHYKEFLEEFSSLKNLSGNYYSVELLKEEDSKNLAYYEDDYHYVKIVFQK